MNDEPIELTEEATTDDLLAKKILALMNGNPTCEEASLLSKEMFIPCGGPAVAVVKNRDVNLYFMCLPCADHNVRNRGAKIVAEKKYADPEMQKLTDDAKALFRGEVSETTTDDLLALSELLVEQKRLKAEAAEAEKKANETIRDLESQMYAIMVEKDMMRFDHAGKLFYPIVNSYPSVVKEHETEFFIWLKENGEDGILKLSVHPQTLRSWYKINMERFAEELAEKELLRVHEEIRIGVKGA